MASSGKVAVNPEHLEGNDGTVYHGLQLWSCWNGPVQYNAWQSVYFSLIRDFKLKDEAPMGETQAEKQARIRAMYNEIQGENYGSDPVCV